MRHTHPLAAVTLASLVSALPAFAQPAPRAGVTAPGQDPTRPIQTSYAEFSYVLPSSVSGPGGNLGDADTLAFQVSHQVTVPFSPTWSGIGGVEWRGTWFDAPSAAPIPESLHEISLRLGALWRFSDRASAQLLLSPGLYSDMRDIHGGDFNAPALLLAFWQLNDQLQLIGGASVNVRRDLPVIPALGARWQFADRWSLLAAYPTPRIEYAATSDLTTFIGAEIIRSAYRVSRNFGDEFGQPALNNQDLSYNEWRVGAGARWQWNPTFHVALEGGWMGEREWNFEDRNVDYTTDGAPYFQISLQARF